MKAWFARHKTDSHSVHPDTLNQCLLLGVKRTLVGDVAMSASDPKRTLVSPRSRNGNYGISATLMTTPQSGLMLATLITLPHFSVSSTMSLLNSVGVIDIGTPPRSAIRAVIFGSTRAALTSLFSLSMICVGVFLGAPRPNHPLAS